MKKILFLTKGHQASSTRDRALIYSDLFKADKFILRHLGLSKNLINYLKALIFAPYYDIIFLQRKLLNYPYFWLLRLLSKKIIYDFDDSIFLKSDGSISETKYKRFKKICKKSDLIFAGNTFLKKYAEEYNRKTFLIPTCLDIDKYNLKTVKSKKYFDIVWVGQKSTSKYLIQILPFLEQAKKSISNLRLINISDVNINSDLITIKNIKWEENSQYKHICSSHLGIAPLAQNNWSKGKCAFKMLQYSSAGLPTISSNVGVNKTLIQKYNSGLLVNSNSDWENNIKKLKKDANLYLKLSNNSLKMSQYFDIKKCYKKMIHLVINEL